MVVRFLGDELDSMNVLYSYILKYYFNLSRTGKNADNKISMSMSFTYQDEFKTLENNEVNSIHEKFIKEMTEKLKLVQR